ncbi:histidine kinase [Pontibacter sp. HSC-14F20]|uniref:histidine kinase n=1 Tax=Pontibacter sp. HSC-14F20 TaxID=2864136 RepID=UPI001C72BB42|nr:histidine kinase [Pontibacter sp. HSC-14F20]MBX0332166.1 histidine kinase [Pontibacter sp. HSC-14F20]
MEAARLDFQQLRIKHILYKSKVRSFLYGGTFDKTFFSTAGPIDIWFSTVGTIRYAREPEISQLIRLHQQLTTLVLSLHKLYSSGQIEQAYDGLKEVDFKSDQFIQILSGLDERLKQV